MARYLIAADVAKILNTSIRAVGQWCKRGSLNPRFLKDGSVVFSAAEVELIKKMSPPQHKSTVKSRAPRAIDYKKRTKDQLIDELTSLKKRNQELERTLHEQQRIKETFGVLINSSIDGILAFDRNFRYTVWNPAMERISGVGKEKALGSYAFDLFPFLKDIGEDKCFFEALNGNDVISKDKRYRVAGMTEDRYFEGYYSPLRNELGGIIGGLAIIRDITERKQSEEERGQLFREQTARAEAEAANHSKDEFIATLSHELRTPLTSILGWARLLRGGQLDKVTVTRAFEIIERNARAQARLIEDLLDISRIITGTLMVELQEVEVMSIMESAIEALNPLSQSKQLTINITDNSDIKSIKVDPTRFQQVINNLLSNAIKFSHVNGVIEIVLNNCDIGLEIVVKDQGRGINPDFLPHVFDRFKQEDTTTTRRTGGLGLGLAIVQHIVQLHGGKISAISDGENLGATFIVQLPVEKNISHRDHRDLRD